MNRSPMANNAVGVATIKKQTNKPINSNPNDFLSFFISNGALLHDNKYKPI